MHQTWNKVNKRILINTPTDLELHGKIVDVEYTVDLGGAEYAKVGDTLVRNFIENPTAEDVSRLMRELIEDLKELG